MWMLFDNVAYRNGTYAAPFVVKISSQAAKAVLNFFDLVGMPRSRFDPVTPHAESRLPKPFGHLRFTITLLH